MDFRKEQIRILVSNLYDLQKMRISVGNRLVQSIYMQMGVKPGASPENVKAALIKYYNDSRDISLLEAAMTGKDKIETVDSEGNKKTIKVPSVIELLIGDYKRVSDMIADNDSIKSVKSAIKEINKSSDNKLNIIRDENDVRLIKSYNLLLDSEEESNKALSKYVEEHPMWDAFFKEIKGCGTLMSAVCLAYLDPYKANHVSCFFKYAGLDTVQDVDKEGNHLFITVDDPKNRRKVKQVFDDTGAEHYYDIETNEEYFGNVVVSCHGRRKGDTDVRPYYVYNSDTDQMELARDEKGELLMKTGITYNPKLKTKLMGVLTGCLLKAKDPVYSTIYYDQRQRLDNSEYHKNKSGAQKNMMAQRYMVKEFLRAMWITWRKLEGLEVDEPYEVAKLGHKPHKYNKYQCDVANEQSKVI